MSVIKVTYLSAVKDIIFKKGIEHKPKIAIVIPAHNEEEDIKFALESIAIQTIPTDMELVVYIALDNCTDRTEEVIRTTNEELGLNIFLLETLGNNKRKVGALNQIYRLLYGDARHVRYRDVGENQKKHAKSIRAFVGMDADAVMEKDAIRILWEELNSVPYIGSVSANYTCRYLEETDVGDLRPTNSFKKRWWVSQQIRDFADWTLRQKQNKHVAEIAGGQCTMFRPEALLDVRDKYKLNGFYDNRTDTEDLLLTQDLRSVGWKCVISKEARCYVDSMDTYTTYVAQRKKWVSGTIDYMLETGLRTEFARKMWMQHLGILVNMVIRLLLITLIPISYFKGVLVWNWIWILPFVFSAILNVMLTFKSPNYTLGDIILTALGINQEIYLWISARIHLEVWVSKLSTKEKDGWAEQYAAERGETVGGWNPFPAIILVAIPIIFYVNRERWVLSSGLEGVIEQYLTVGYPVLSLLTITMTLNVIRKIWKLRHPHKP